MEDKAQEHYAKAYKQDAILIKRIRYKQFITHIPRETTESEDELNFNKRVLNPNIKAGRTGRKYRP